MSLYTKHVDRWKNCERCPYCETRTKVVFVRGHLPCDVLMVGEAPGQSEDRKGIPFHGPAGKLLDQLVEQALDGATNIRIAYTNLVSCIPTEEEGQKFGEPNRTAIDACLSKLREIIEIAKPQIIVKVGKLAAKYTHLATEEGVKKYMNRDIQWGEIVHPSSILRADVSNKGLMVQTCIIALRDIFELVVPF